MITFSKSDYSFLEGDVQKRPPFNVFLLSIAFNLVRAPEGAYPKNKRKALILKAFRYFYSCLFCNFCIRQYECRLYPAIFHGPILCFL